MKGQRNISCQHLYAHFCVEGHRGLEDLVVQIIDVTDVKDILPLEKSIGFKCLNVNMLHRV